MRKLAAVSLVLVLVLTSLSAYLRLAHSGIGCADWPACYGRIGAPPASGEVLSSSDAWDKPADESSRTPAWATPLHRLIASVLGLLVLGLFYFSLRQKRHRLLCAALVGLTAFLALLGIRSGSLHDPAIVVGNLAGGFAMLALMGWLVFAMGPRGHPHRPVAALSAVAVAALCLQILLGGLTSANFAALACTDLPQCQDGWWPGPALAAAVDLTREHAVNASGQAIGGPERVAIHRAHHLGAIVTLILTALAAFAAMAASRRFRTPGAAVLLAACAVIAVGLASVIGDIPMALALSHNVLAALLLLALLRLLVLSSDSRRKSRS